MGKLTGQHISYDLTKRFDAIVLFEVARAKGLPPALGYGRVFTLSTSYMGIDIDYDLNAMVEMREGRPVCLYYVAYNRTYERTEYCLGPRPEHVEAFAREVDWYFVAATHFYGVFGTPSQAAKYTALSADAAARGDLVGMVENFGKSWLAALQDPEWWMASGAGVGAYGTGKSMATRLARNERAYRRALTTRLAVQYRVKRSIRITSRPEKFWHEIVSENPAATFVRIRRTGGLKLSRGGSTGQYGPGAYAWGWDKPRSSAHHIEFEVPAGTAVELIEAPTGSFYRLVPPEGEFVPIKITSHTFSADDIKMGEFFAD